MYSEYFSGEKRLSKMFGKIVNVESLSTVLATTLEESSREGLTRIQFVPTKGIMLEMSGQIANACWADEYDSINESMPNTSAIIMRARPDEKTEKIVGAALLIETFSPETGEKVLLLRGTNPTENYINTVDPSDFFNAISNYVNDIANKRGMIPAVVIDDHCGGSGTNRPSLFSYLQKEKNQLEKIVVDNATTNFNDYNITNDTYRLDGRV
ncbi:MAG: hypothetical protein ACOX6Q_02615 [Candidatus Dojkabacteria bacterium]|jgi:hypothetical protein